MDIEFDTLADDRIAVIRFIGPAGDADVTPLYEALLGVGHQDDTRPQLVDGRLVTDVSLTRQGMERMAGRLGRHRDTLRLRRVAFLADRDLVFGIFRMWEAERGELGGEAQVFRDEEQAVAWLLNDPPTAD